MFWRWTSKAHQWTRWIVSCRDWDIVYIPLDFLRLLLSAALPSEIATNTIATTYPSDKIGAWSWPGKHGWYFLTLTFPEARIGENEFLFALLTTTWAKSCLCMWMHKEPGTPSHSTVWGEQVSAVTQANPTATGVHLYSVPSYSIHSDRAESQKRNRAAHKAKISLTQAFWQNMSPLLKDNLFRNLNWLPARSSSFSGRGQPDGRLDSSFLV